MCLQKDVANAGLGLVVLLRGLAVGLKVPGEVLALERFSWLLGRVFRSIGGIRPVCQQASHLRINYLGGLESRATGSYSEREHVCHLPELDGFDNERS